MPILDILLETKFFVYLTYMVIAHFICDFILPSSWVSANRQPGSVLYHDDGTKTHSEPIWGWVLVAHAALNAGAVVLITGWFLLAYIKFAQFAIVKNLKDRHVFGKRWPFAIDQTIHLLFAVVLSFAGILLDGVVF